MIKYHNFGNTDILSHENAFLQETPLERRLSEKLQDSNRSLERSAYDKNYLKNVPRGTILNNS